MSLARIDNNIDHVETNVYFLLSCRFGIPARKDRGATRGI